MYKSFYNFQGLKFIDQCLYVTEQNSTPYITRCECAPSPLFLLIQIQSALVRFLFLVGLI